LGAGLGALREGDGDGAGADALTRIQQAIASLGPAEKASPACRAIGERLRSVRIELEDVVGEIEQTAENVVVNPSKHERLSATRDTVMRLMAKHSATDPGELLERQAELSARLESAQHRLKRLAALDGEIAEAVELTEHRGLLLHERRSEAARALARKTVEMLKGLKMPAVELNWDWRQLEAPAAHGLYGHNLMFSANPGHQAQPIEKVASGGERSRLLLAIRAVLAQHAEVPTLILDEIDTGVSGEVADRMARLMASIAENTQVITITHLPQVAACAPHQQRISKHTDGGRARTQVEALDELQRVEELAGMLSGSEITDDARAQARQLRAAT
jgi:DNA repair protein RecN (Recombination protein N)